MNPSHVASFQFEHMHVTHTIVFTHVTQDLLRIMHAGNLFTQVTQKLKVFTHVTQTRKSQHGLRIIYAVLQTLRK
jgi:hypothetical protein